MTSIEKLIESTENVVDGMHRNEKILVLPYNTLRLMDLPIQVELYAMMETIDDNMTTTDLKNKILCRGQSLAEANGVDKELLNELIRRHWDVYYEMAPKGRLYDILNILAHQKFAESVTVLFPDKRVKDTNDGIFKNDYYDGTYGGLVSYIQTHSVTCIVLDDVELLLKLVKEPTISFNYMTVMLTKIGYNYEKTKDMAVPQLKHYDEISELAFMEMCTLSLFGGV